jgi:hypothetical protein
MFNEVRELLILTHVVLNVSPFVDELISLLKVFLGILLKLYFLYNLEM